MRAAILVEQGRDLVVDQVELPPALAALPTPDADEVAAEAVRVHQHRLQ